MWAFLSNFGLLITIVSGISTIISVVVTFIRSRQHPAFRWKGSILSLIILILFLMTLTAWGMTGLQRSQASGNNIGSPPLSSTAPQTTGNNTPVPPTATPTPSPSPTPPPAPGTILCQYNSSTGWNGWNGTSDWKVYNNMLLNDGTLDEGGYSQRTPTVVAPCQMGDIADYAVEVKIQVIQSVNYDACFGINVRGTSSDPTQGYTSVVDLGCFSGTANTVRISVDEDSQVLSTGPFNPGTSYHTYRVEAQGTTIKFFIDGGLILQANDNRYLTGGQIGLWDSHTELNVSSFKVIAL